MSLFLSMGGVFLKYKIADFITEYEPKFKILRNLSKPFQYFGLDETEIKLNISSDAIERLLTKMTPETTIAQAEEFAYSGAFNKAIIKHNSVFIHSSALIYDGGAYLFSARSGVGKSTHTKLWREAFPDKVQMINDDKPVVRLYNDKVIAYGTPFDGGSGIANNISAPLKAIVFVERGEENSVSIPSTSEVIQNLYMSSLRFINKESATLMLSNFEKLVNLTDFYILKCNTDISSAYIARDAIIKR